MCRSTSPTCAARTVRPKPTPELADSACRPTSRTVPRRTLGQINDQCRARRAADRRSRARRWYDAVAELVILQSEYAQWFETLPENLQGALPARHCKRSSTSTSTNLIAVVRSRRFGRD